MSNKISDKDKKDWQDFLSNKEYLADKDEPKKEKYIFKSKSFDLHGYSLNEANNKIFDLICDAYNDKINKLIIVTGKGIHSQNEKDPYVSKDLGILKNSVPEYILGNPELTSKINKIENAKTEDGGSGAFYIYLKKKL